MSFPRYPTYKDSGMEWLGQVPGHWGVGSARWLTRRYSGGTPDKTNLAYWEDGTIPWLNSGAVNDRLITAPSTYITAEAFANSSAKWIPKSALVMALAGQGKTKGMVAQLAIPSTCNQSMAAIIPGAEIDARFLFWWLESNYQNIRNMAGGDLRDGLNLELLGSIQCPLPLQGEQIQIAAFLDRETAKIDGLVAEQRRLMELLKEKRQAVISHAVTQGLNPHAPMKPSGIEWIGDVPAHWGTPSLYMRYSSELGKMLDSSKITGKHLIPYARNVDVQWGSINLDDLPYMDIREDEYERYTVKAGDLLICEGGEVGRAAIVPAVDGVFGYQKALHRLRKLDESEVTQFMYFTFLWAATTGIFDQSGSSTIAHLTGEQLRKYRFPKPPVAEQAAIAAFLESETAKFDTLTTEAQRAIDLLQERRTALISAAVTGQIDVREFA